jgi:hypothetical protein
VARPSWRSMISQRNHVSQPKGVEPRGLGSGIISGIIYSNEFT